MIRELKRDLIIVLCSGCFLGFLFALSGRPLASYWSFAGTPCYFCNFFTNEDYGLYINQLLDFATGIIVVLFVYLFGSYVSSTPVKTKQTSSQTVRNSLQPLHTERYASKSQI